MRRTRTLNRYRLSPRVAARVLRKKPEQIKHHLLQAERRNVERVLETALSLSAGEASESYLSEYRPYSRVRWATPLLDPTVINAHFFAFFNGWRTSGPDVVEETVDKLRIESMVFNVSEHVRQLLAEGGTLTAHERPILQRVREMTYDDTLRARRGAIRAALREGNHG